MKSPTARSVAEDSRYRTMPWIEPVAFNAPPNSRFSRPNVCLCAHPLEVRTNPDVNQVLSVDDAVTNNRECRRYLEGGSSSQRQHKPFKGSNGRSTQDS